MSRLVFGAQPVRELLRARGGRGVRIYLQNKETEDRRLESLGKLAQEVGAEIFNVDRGELDRRAKGGMHQGALAEAPPLVILEDRALIEALETADRPAVAILDGVVDPHNFGAVIRSAVALGAPWVVWGEHASAPLTPTTFRASAGAVEHARLARVRSLPGIVRTLAEMSFTVALLDPDGDVALHEVDLAGPCAIIIGAEEKGAKPAVRKAATHRARLPMSGKVQSLNASVAGAIAFYEVMRQRNFGIATAT
ncbi:MAG: 23S rRNA (guanosine(2251)-2'-O)-methyltransferase RlmB [Polyangiaceae bacterium]|nr:23S rRNA (guanosine(2251)-2'-O)-methyltransferase RlmB [Polyangiaceae bacterium]